MNFLEYINIAIPTPTIANLFLPIKSLPLWVSIYTQIVGLNFEVE